MSDSFGNQDGPHRTYGNQPGVVNHNPRRGRVSDDKVHDTMASLAWLTPEQVAEEFVRMTELANTLRADRDRLAADLTTAQQRIEWASAALHGDPLFGPGCDEPLVRGIQALAADLEAVRRVGAWMRSEPSRRVSVGHDGVVLCAYEFDQLTASVRVVYEADSLPALGRALAAREAK